MKKEEGYEYIFKDVELQWCRLGAPESPFGTLQNSLTIFTDDVKVAQDWKKKKFRVKDLVDDTFTINLKRKAQNPDGTMREPVRVVDSKRTPIPPATLIGNGSKGNVKVWVFPYADRSNGGKTAWSASLVAVQIIDLIKYEPKPTNDFDDVDGGYTTDGVDYNLQMDPVDPGYDDDF